MALTQSTFTWTTWCSRFLAGTTNQGAGRAGRLLWIVFLKVAEDDVGRVRSLRRFVASHGTVICAFGALGRVLRARRSIECRASVNSFCYVSRPRRRDEVLDLIKAPNVQWL